MIPRKRGVLCSPAANSSETVYALAAKFVEAKSKPAFVKVFGTNAVSAYRLM